jgi:chromatin remodeling complex protein RSC6
MSKVTTSTKATPKTTTKKTTKAKEVSVEPVPTPVVETTTAPVETTTTAPLDATTTVAEVELTDATSMKQRFELMIKSRQTLMNDLKREIQELRKMQRDHEHAVKEASKKSKKKKTQSDDATPRKPSGFASPVIVSDDLYSFLSQFGVKKGDPIARTDVTRHITSYIKEKDLQNPDHRREIVPDAALHKLFGPAIEPKDPNDANSPLVYTYLKLQRYLSPHFPKKASA